MAAYLPSVNLLSQERLTKLLKWGRSATIQLMHDHRKSEKFPTCDCRPAEKINDDRHACHLARS